MSVSRSHHHLQREASKKIDIREQAMNTHNSQATSGESKAVGFGIDSDSYNYL